MVKNQIWNPLLGALENKIESFVSERINLCHNVAVLVTVESKSMSKSDLAVPLHNVP